MKRWIHASNSIQLTDNEGNAVPEEIAAKLASTRVKNLKGQLIVCYHGTNSDFNEFKEDFISSNSSNIGWCRLLNMFV